MSQKQNKFCALMLALIVSMIFVLSSCQNASPAPNAASESASSAVSSAVEEVPADRSREIFSTEEDTGKLVIRFFKMKSNSDVKSGDSSLITFPDGKNMLVDTTSPECAPILIQYLKNLNITKIDALLISHPHIDHLGGMPAVAEAFPIGQVYRSKVENSTDTYQKFVAAIEEKDIPVRYLQEGDEFDFGTAHFKILNPEPEIVYPENSSDTNTQFINNQSIAVKITYEDSSIFLGGDLYVPAENRLIKKYGENLQCDIMKANHHGADTSNSRSFIEVVKPKVVVAMHDGISSLDVYNAFHKRGAEMYITSVDGCVKITADGTKNYTWITQYDRQQNSVLK